MHELALRLHEGHARKMMSLGNEAVENERPGTNRSGSSGGRSCCRRFVFGDLLCPALPSLGREFFARKRTFEVVSVGH